MTINYIDDFTIIPVKVLVDGEYAYDVENGIKLYEKDTLESYNDFDLSDEYKDCE